MLPITHNNFLSKPWFDAEVTKRLQTVDGMLCLAVCLKVSNADKAHDGANLLARRFGPFVHLSLRGTYVGCNKVSAGARGT